MNILILFLAIFGATFIFVHAKIMDILRIRPFLNRFEFTRELQKCSLCSGFYISALFGIFYIPLNMLIPFICAGAGVAFYLERTVILIDELVIKLEKERR
jgi:hypothetical protein